MNEESPYIRRATDENFDAEVFERSQKTPVIVDFWATWCQPCLMLAPVLESLAKEFQGAFYLVKAETSEAEQAAAKFNVASIPALFAVVAGEVVDMQVGGAPESHLREWLSRILQFASLREAELLESSDPATAESKYRAAVAEDADNAAAQIGLARVRLAQGDSAEAAEIIAQLEARGFLEPEAQKVQAAIHLHADEAADLTELQNAVDANPEDFQAALELARGLAAAARHEEALERCLALVQNDRHGAGEEARKLMIDLFRILPDDSELAGEYRRRLSTALF